MNKTAYLQIDFAFVVLIFFIFFFTIFQLQSNANKNTISKLDLIQTKSDSFDICNLLISSSGNPTNWENNISSLNFLGLKNISSYQLNINKINALNQANLDKIYSSLGISNILKINIIGLNSSTNYLSFGYEPENYSVVSSNSCFSTLNGEIVKINVEVWK